MKKEITKWIIMSVVMLVLALAYSAVRLPASQIVMGIVVIGIVFSGIMAFKK